MVTFEVAQDSWELGEWGICAKNADFFNKTVKYIREYRRYPFCGQQPKVGY